MSVSWTTLDLSVSTPTSGRLHPRTRGNGARRRNKGWDVLWEIYRCRESQGWTTACNSMPERDGKDQDKERIAQSKQRACASSPAITVDKPQVAGTCILRAFLLCLSMSYCLSLAFHIFSSCFVPFGFRLFLLSSLNPRPFVQSFFGCLRPDSHTQLANNCMRPFFSSLEVSIAVSFLYGE